MSKSILTRSSIKTRDLRTISIVLTASVWIPDEVIEEQRTSLDRNKDGILSYKELLFGLLRKFQIEGRLKSMKILMIACKTNQRKLNLK